MLISEKDCQKNMRMLRLAAENTCDGYATVHLNEETSFGVSFKNLPAIGNIFDDVDVSEYEEIPDLIIDDETLETEFPDDESNLKKLLFALMCVPIVRISFWQFLTPEDIKDLEYYRSHRFFQNYTPNLDLDSFGAGMALNDRLSPDGHSFFNSVERD